MGIIDSYQPEVSLLITEWCRIGENADNPWLKFSAFYYCLNAATAIESENYRDKQMVEDLCRRLTDSDNRDSPLVKSMDTAFPSMSGLIAAFKEKTPIFDPRNHASDPGVMSTEDDLPGLVRCFYRIRCNLFHARKKPFDERDQLLVSTAAEILALWMEALVLELQAEPRFRRKETAKS